MGAGAAPLRRVYLTRTLTLTASFLAAGLGFVVFLQFGASDGFDAFDVLRALLIFASTFWLAWGAFTALAGLTTQPPAVPRDPGPVRAMTAILVPVYNEDPVATFARIAAMDASLRATGFGDRFHFAILSDTRNDEVAARERIWFLRLLADTHGEGRIFYRRRTSNKGRKAGNIEDFIKRAGAAYSYAIILDADSLMEGATMVEMVRRMEAAPDLGLLQTLPKVIRARSRFGRIMQFAGGFYSPIFARGLAMMQGRTGPFWGHNAIVRMRAFAESCGLPELSGKPPFGGHILSHDYVEAALLARAGWTVRVDDDLQGSYEEAPENIIDHAKRDRRWCQGNLQHSRLLLAPGLKPWSRFVFLQGILAYIAPVFWLAFLAASIAAPLFAPPIDYFPIEYWPFPVIPVSQVSKALGLAVGVGGLLFLPKLLILLDAALRGRTQGFGGRIRALQSTLTELLFSSLTAPIFLMFQTRSVLQVLRGADGGWPAQTRGDGTLNFRDAWAASHWIVTTGGVVLVMAQWLSPELVLWLMPVALPMVLAPLLISWSSRPSRSALFTVETEIAPAPVMQLHDRILVRWDEDLEDRTAA
ncbi:glucans biosynthesis glucosyltransferase MdoH [Tabrizicola sp. TH137]|uniref:glucans biosynthesis glucosyltransferase MdoH n=1 Tax=Tabrizicola sp. TH137 TaxID=2067452 RepID=UPI000C79E1F0|nr:glucans biosynthesis glucosyltransferase MdoH [Tabrizicola sp. TH137]